MYKLSRKNQGKDEYTVCIHLSWTLGFGFKQKS